MGSTSHAITKLPITTTADTIVNTSAIARNLALLESRPSARFSNHMIAAAKPTPNSAEAAGVTDCAFPNRASADFGPLVPTMFPSSLNDDEALLTYIT